MFKRISFFVFALFVFTVQMKAVPAYKAKRVVMIGNEKVELTLNGDDSFHYWAAADGRCFVEGKNGYVGITLDEVRDAYAANARRKVAAHRRALGDKISGGIVGKKRGLVILMSFANCDFTSSSNPHQTFNDFFNKVGYSDNGMKGSVHDYFYDQSYGKFDLQFDVVGPYKAKHQYAYYGQNDGNRTDVNVAELVKEACDNASTEVNFSNYDWDEDGVVDQVYIIYAGYGENYGNEANVIWPHESNVSSMNLSYNQTAIATYAVSCELSGTSGNEMSGIGVPCHEFSHCLGLPDMYDTGYSGVFGMNKWDIMDQGCYNEESKCPCGYTSYERWFAGWLEPVELSSRVDVKDMKALEDSPEAYIMYNDADRNEYYLLENRQPSKWDSGLDGHGLLVVHVDFDKMSWQSNKVNSTVDHPRVTIVPADGVLSSNQYSISGDPYPGVSQNTALNYVSSPAAKVYNKNVDGSYYLGKGFDSLTETADGLISFVACRPQLTTPYLNEPTILSDNSFSISWDKIENAVSYTVEVKEVPAAVHDYESNLIIHEDFKKCISKSLGFTDISTKLGDYLAVSGWNGSKLYCSPKGLRLGTSSATGYLFTPEFTAPLSAQVTCIIKYNLVDSKATTGFVRLYSSKGGNKDRDFELSEDGYLVYTFSNVYEDYRVGIVPDSRLNIEEFYVLEGEWSSEEIAGSSASSAKRFAPRKIENKEIVLYDNIFRLDDANPTSTYYVKVRANDEVTYSFWSNEVEVKLGATSISSNNNECVPVSVSYYDVLGRAISAPKSGDIFIERSTYSDGSVKTRKVVK